MGCYPTNAAITPLSTPPRMQAIANAGLFPLSWPGYAGGCTLLHATSLAPSAIW